MPKWIFDLVDQLAELKDTMESYGGTKLREPSKNVILNSTILCRSVAGLNWIHFERADFVPSNFVAIGDSVMKVNPSFGYVFYENTIPPGRDDIIIQARMYQGRRRRHGSLTVF